MNTQKILVTVAIALGVAVAGLAGVCGYQYLAAAATAQAISVQRDEFENANRYKAELVKAHANSKTLTTKVLQHRAPWTWSEQLPVMVTQISGIVEGCGAKIDTLQPAPIVERQQVIRFPLHLSLHTNLASLSKFLQRTQQAVPLLAIDQLTVRAGKLPIDPLQVDVTLSSYVMLEGQAAGGRL